MAIRARAGRQATQPPTLNPSPVFGGGNSSGASRHQSFSAPFQGGDRGRSDQLAERIPPGRLVEIVGGHPTSAQTTAAVACLVHAQAHGETAAWVQPEGGALYPPDLADGGVDLEALVVVHVPARAGPHGRFKAAELLLRSGGFGMVVVDCGSSVPSDPAWQSRLFALAREHGSSLLLLTPARAHLGSLVALRVEPRRTRGGRGRFAIEYLVCKDKTGQCASLTADSYRGPCGLS